MRLLIVLAALLLPRSLAAQSVMAEAGNLFYRASSQAAPRQLTFTGLDGDPALSPDGRMVAFVRGTPGDSVRTALGRDEATSLWIVGVDGSSARMLVRGRSADRPEQMLARLQAPQFAPDGRRIYVLSSAWATSGALHSVEVASGGQRFVAPGNSLEVVPSGKYAGHLIVSQHRYFLAGGSYDWMWLITPDGAEVGPVGEGMAAVEEFRTMHATP